MKFLLLVILVIYLITNGKRLVLKYVPIYIIKSVYYPFYKRKVDKLFQSLNVTDRRDLWLNSFISADLDRWYNRRLERFIREKYINSIVDRYASVRTD